MTDFGPDANDPAERETTDAEIAADRPAFTVTLVQDGEVDTYAFDSLEGATSFADQVQSWLGRHDMAFDITVTAPQNPLLEADADVAFAEFVSMMLMED